MSATPRPYRKWEPEELQRFAALYPVASREELTRAFPDRPFSGLNEIARRHGIKCRVQRGRRGSLRPLLREVPEAYYWMGYFAADGWMSKTNQLVVVCAAKDESHLGRLARFLGTNVRVIPKKQRRVAVQDVENGPFVSAKFGLVSQKTQHPPATSLTGWRFLSYWAGFIDGDGSICRVPGRLHCHLRIECHAGWTAELGRFVDQLYRELRWPTRAVAPKVNRRGYAYLAITNDGVLRRLKKSLAPLVLPLMARKWDRIQGRA